MIENWELRGSTNPSSSVRFRLGLVESSIASVAVVQLRKTSREKCIIKVTQASTKNLGRLDIQHHNSHAGAVRFLRWLASCMHFSCTSAMMHLDGSSITKNIIDWCFSMAQKIFANNATLVSYASDWKLCNSIYGTCWKLQLLRLLAWRKMTALKRCRRKLCFSAEISLEWRADDCAANGCATFTI